MKYELEIKKEKIDYGIIKGNNKIFFIKVGQDGSIYGYGNKYIRIAKNINKKYGYTVICASNPFDGTNPLDNDMNFIEEYSKKYNLKEYEIYYFGVSNGARVALIWGYLYSKINKMILVNSPLMINLHRIKEGLKQMNNKKIYLIFDENDPSIKYTELLTRLLNDNIKLEIIKNADHYFTNQLEEFIKLSEKYL